MTKAAAELLIRRLEKPGESWPLKSEVPIIKDIAKWAAYREKDNEALREIAGWDEDRDYIVDPLPEKIADVYADLLFGEEPKWTPSNKGDVDVLRNLLEESDVPGELHWAEQMCTSEGETWARLWVNRDLAAHPLFEFHSRENVVPHWVGNRLASVGFVSEFEGRDTDPGKSDQERVVYRHIEIHSTGRVENRLYRGTKSLLGENIALIDHPETEGLIGEWDHDLPGMLAGQIPNRRGRNRRVGRSDYQGIEDYLRALNEVATIGQENARLTLKRRAVLPASAMEPPRDITPSIDAGDGSRIPIRRKPVFNTAEDIFIANSLDKTLGEGSDGPFKVLEYSFDAEAFVTYKRDLLVSALTRVGITPQFIGSFAGFEGTADTGAALRVRLIPTDAAARGKGRRWDKFLPELVMMAQLLDAAKEEAHGFSVGWSSPAKAPDFERTDPLPEDETEKTARHISATGGKAIESVQTAIEEGHPDWDDDRVQEEIRRIDQDREKAAPPSLFGTGNKPGDDGEDEDKPPNPAGETVPDRPPGEGNAA